jgi:integrase
MINRENWKLINAYKKYRSEVDRLVPGSMNMERSCLAHLLEWCDVNPIWLSPKIKPSFPEYLKNHSQISYSAIYTRKVLGAALRFFQWLVKHYPQYQKTITLAWMDSFKPNRSQSEDNEHEFVTLDEIRAIAQVPVVSVRDRRIQAAMVFLYLSAMRGGAFVTLPIKAVDLNNKKIFQWPSLGVHTKFNKKGTTHLLDIPDLTEVIKRWDDDLRINLPETSYWFAPLSSETGNFDQTIKEVGNCRISRLNKDIKDFLSKYGLPYHSSHKFRHGHAVFGLQNSKDIADLKAVSQNLMHANLSTTDGVYGMFSVDGVGKRIANLGIKMQSGNFSKEDFMSELQELINKYS